MAKKYWMCIVEVDVEKKLPKDGFDSVPRGGVVNSLRGWKGLELKNCWSGWGMTEEQFEDVMREWNRTR